MLVYLPNSYLQYFGKYFGFCPNCCKCYSVFLFGECAFGKWDFRIHISSLVSGVSCISKTFWKSDLEQFTYCTRKRHVCVLTKAWWFPHYPPFPTNSKCICMEMEYRSKTPRSRFHSDTCGEVVFHFSRNALPPASGIPLHLPILSSSLPSLLLNSPQSRRPPLITGEIFDQ